MALSYGESLYGSGLYAGVLSPALARLTAYSLSVDGHPLVFLDLGENETLVFDSLFQKWSSWDMAGSVGFPAKTATKYRELNLIGDKSSGKIFSLDVREMTDDGQPFNAVVTGGLPMRMRKALACAAVYPAGSRSDQDGEISLYISDDNGETWEGQGTQTQDAEEIAWRALGTIRAPGRIFELQDTGVFESIDGLDMAVDGES